MRIEKLLSLYNRSIYTLVFSNIQIRNDKICIFGLPLIDLYIVATVKPLSGTLNIKNLT